MRRACGVESVVRSVVVEYGLLEHGGRRGGFARALCKSQPTRVRLRLLAILDDHGSFVRGRSVRREFAGSLPGTFLPRGSFNVLSYG